MDTIVALSSGRPPAAIAVIRVSGPEALAAAAALAGRLPLARRAGLRALRDEAGRLLDRALVLVFPGPDSATGEDLVELHCHGGRAVVAAVEAALAARPGLRRAEPGEFTRRALINGRIDLAEAEGLADLLEAETEGQRRAALMASEGQVSRAVRGWLDRTLALAAAVEASLEFAEEGDVAREADLLDRARRDAAALREEIAATLAAPPVERLRDGLRVVIAGPPNSGKSTLLNLMVAREAAIVSPVSGTTRDRIEAPVQRGGAAFLLTDTAGLTEAADPVERIGVGRAQDAIFAADLLLWLGDAEPPRDDALWVHARADLPGRETLPPGRHAAIRQDRPGAIAQLWAEVERRAGLLLPTPDIVPLKARQRDACQVASTQLVLDYDPIIAAEQLRTAASALGGVLGLNATEAMLDALFGRFCIGK
jgi:tRNA modification GTPase